MKRKNETQTVNSESLIEYPKYIRFDFNNDWPGNKIPEELREIFDKILIGKVPLFTHRDILVSDATTGISIKIVCEDEINLANSITKLSSASLNLDNPTMDGKNLNEAKKYIKEAQELLIKIQNNIEGKIYDS